MKTGQRAGSNSDQAWMVPNKPGIGCRAHKPTSPQPPGPESWLCQCTKNIYWAKARELLYCPVTQTASLGSGQLQLLETTVELSLWQPHLMRIESFLAMVKLWKVPFAFLLGYLLPFHPPQILPILWKPTPPSPFLSVLPNVSAGMTPPLSTFILRLVPCTFSTSYSCSGVGLYLLCLSGEMSPPV